MENIREIVLEILLDIEKNDTFGDSLIKQVMEKYDYLPQQEKAFLKRLSEGTLEKKITLEYVINQFSKVPVKKMKPLIRCIMRMSCYQLLFMDSVPDSAVCNEAVKLAKKRGFHSLSGFVNGVLRSIARGKDGIRWPDKTTEFLASVSVETGIPELILEVWERAYGRERCERIARGLAKESPMTIRVDETLNPSKREDLLKAWEQAGITYSQHPYLDYAFICKASDGVKYLPGFQEGKCTVQDVSSMLAVHCANIREGDTVFDVCAAPGGKTLHAACKLKGTGKVYSRDVSPYKTDMIRESAERMRLTNVEVSVFDATKTDAENDGKADVLLMDVPCSGLGILGKKQDIKYHVTKESLEQILSLQKEIADHSVSLLKPGGTLLYSTCTIRPEENLDMVKYLEEKHGLKPESLDDLLPQMLKNDTSKQGYIQLFPGEHSCDGFFFARLRKL